MEEVLSTTVDIVIMDVIMPQLNGFEAARQIMAQNPSIKIIAVSMHSGRSYVQGMIKAGVSAYVLKNRISKELVSAVHSAAADQPYLSPEIAAKGF